MLNALTIDVEDYFQVSAFERHVRRDDWDSYPLRVEGNTQRILEMLDEFGVKATFFVLGWVAERKPGLVKEIVRRGHELASHGYGHQRVCNQTREEFRSDVKRSKSILEELAGKPVIGYRAPSYSISLDTLWAYDELLDAGYRYDSSVFPIRHDLYGIPDWPRHPFTIEKGADGQWRPLSGLRTAVSGQLQADPSPQSPETFPQFKEIPITTLSLAGKNFPIAGGGYFRLFPYPFTQWGLKRINRLEGRSFVFYFHPWEIDTGQPRIRAGAKSRFRHYLNLDGTEGKLRRMLGAFRFAPISQLADIAIAPRPPSPSPQWREVKQR
jgi:polysaccharide deacetylase family protein (PEP-CTERM system associated)